MMLHKDIFLQTEGDAWLHRNESSSEASSWQMDPVCIKVAWLPSDGALDVLQMGCADGSRLEYLARTHGHRVAGVDPSGESVSRAMQRGIRIVRSTADVLPVDAGAFDVVIF